MQCKKCGAVLLETDKFCKVCGEPVQVVNNSQNNNFQNQQSNQSYINNGLEGINQNNNAIQNDMSNQGYSNQNFGNSNNYQQVGTSQNYYQQGNAPINNSDNNKKKKNKIIPKILMIIGGFIILFVVIFSIVSATSEKLVCSSDKGNITIMYNEKGLTGYKTSGMSYDFDEQKQYANKIGIDAYIKEFSSWFSNNTSGTCTVNGKKIEENTSNNTSNNNNNNSSNTNVTDTKIVGDDKYGYISIPNNWGKFYDVDGNDSLQYSYANVYIVSLNILDGQYSAKEYASNYMYNKQNSSDVTGVNGATVKIGKNKEYTAYQVYMYYPSDSTYLVTYWFEAEDGKVHYIALEGPEELSGVKITDYLYIPESFSIKK